MRIIAVLACVAAFAASSIVKKNTRYYSGANVDRTFQASVVGVALTQHEGFECSAGVNQSTENVIRITFDRDVRIWSDNGTGEGYYFPTRSIDLGSRFPYDAQKLAFFLGKEKRTFHYSGSFLSICDESHIPTVQYFGIE